MTTNGYAQAWSDLETIRLGLEHTTSAYGPAGVDYSLRLAQALLAEHLGYANRVDAQRAHDARTTTAFRARVAMAHGAAELRAIHAEHHPGCVDQGPDTCPTWEAIHALEDPNA